MNLELKSTFGESVELSYINGNVCIEFETYDGHFDKLFITLDQAAAIATWLTGTITQEKQRRTFVLGEECAQGDCDCDLWDGLRVLPDDFPPKCPDCDCETVR